MAVSQVCKEETHKKLWIAWVTSSSRSQPSCCSLLSAKAALGALGGQELQALYKEELQPCPPAAKLTVTAGFCAGMTGAAVLPLSIQQPPTALPSSQLPPAGVRPWNPSSGSPTAPVTKLGLQPRSPGYPPELPAAAGWGLRSRLSYNPPLPTALQLWREPNTHHWPQFQEELWTGKTQNCWAQVFFPFFMILKKHQEPSLNLPQVCSKQETFAVSDFTYKSALRKTATVMEGIKNWYN